MPVDVKTLRRIDRALGLPVCALLTLWRKLTPALTRRPVPVRRILFVKLLEQGSTVLAHAAIAEAVRRVGRENVFFLVFEENRAILDVMGAIPHDHVLALRCRGVLGLLPALARLLVQVRRLRVDAAIDLEFFSRASAILSFLSGAPIRVGLHAYFGEGRYRGDLMTHRISFNPARHTSELFQLLVRALDVAPASLPALPLEPPPPMPAPRFEPRSDETERVQQLLREACPTAAGAPLVLLHANCSDLLPLRQWPRERYVALARALLEKYRDVHVAFTGVASEAIATAELVRAVRSERAFSLAGKTDLRELLALCTLAEVLVTNDSGPAHFATLTPVDVITLFGPESPALFAARSPRNHVRWAGIACSPCINALNDRQSACRDNLCMQAIGVDDVLAVVSETYERRLARRAARV